MALMPEDNSASFHKRVLSLASYTMLRKKAINV